MISHKQISKIIEDLEKENEKDSLKIANSVYDFLNQNNLLALLPKSIKHLKNIKEEDLRNDTLIIKCSDKNIPPDVLDNIKKVLSVDSEKQVVFEDLLPQDTGFIASYGGMVFDCRVSTNGKLLLERLKQAI